MSLKMFLTIKKERCKVATELIFRAINRLGALTLVRPLIQYRQKWSWSSILSRVVLSNTESFQVLLRRMGALSLSIDCCWTTMGHLTIYGTTTGILGHFLLSQELPWLLLEKKLGRVPDHTYSLKNQDITLVNYFHPLLQDG